MKIKHLLTILLILWLSPVKAETVLITGSNRGIGFEFAKQYAESGWKVIATARNPDSADQLKALAAEYYNVVIEQLDVTNLERISSLAKEYQGTAIDVLINNAGVLGDKERQTFGTYDRELFQKMMAVNVFAPVKMSEAFARHVAASKQKKIVVISSISGSISSLNFADLLYYPVSKAAVNMAMKGVSLLLKEQGIAIGIYHPGGVNTRMLRQAFGATKENEGDPNFNFGSYTPLTPEESVKQLRERIAELDAEKSGKFLSYAGEELPW